MISVDKLTEKFDFIMKEFHGFQHGTRVMMLINRGIGNTNKGSKRWINKLISHDRPSFENNLEKLLAQQYFINNPDIRLYLSLNDRKMDAAIKLFQHKQIDIVDEQMKLDFYTRINDKFCSCLMQPENRNTKLFLIDLDNKNTAPKEFLLNHNLITIVKIYETVKGYHFITFPFDPRIITHIPDCEVKKDALLLLNCIER